MKCQKKRIQRKKQTKTCDKITEREAGKQKKQKER